MELLLALAVITAVIIFGALISLGNERQRRALDELREQVVLWAIQDLKIKRRHLEQTVQVPDPLGWLNKIASNVCGYNLHLQVLDVFETPQSLVCSFGNGSNKVIFSPLSQADLRQIGSSGQNRLSQFSGNNPLLHLTKDVRIHELSLLNAGCFFDLELSLAWKALTDKDIRSQESLWVYII